jgi:hypothetical protein
MYELASEPNSNSTKEPNFPTHSRKSSIASDMSMPATPKRGTVLDPDYCISTFLSSRADCESNAPAASRRFYGTATMVETRWEVKISVDELLERSWWTAYVSKVL